MVRWVRVLCVVAVVGVATVQQARADVTFSFVQTSATPAGALTFAGQVIVTDAAANGFSFTLRNENGNNAQFPMPTPSLSGLLGLSFSVDNAGGVDLSGALPDFFRQSNPGSGMYYTISIAGSHASGLSGGFYFNNSESDVRLMLSGFAGSGGFNSDAGGSSCGRTGACTFTVATVVTVPEPASLAVFGAGLLGLGLVRRRKQA